MFMFIVFLVISLTGVAVNLYIVYHILASQYQKTIFDLGMVKINYVGVAKIN